MRLSVALVRFATIQRLSGPGKTLASRCASRERADPFPASLDEATMWIKSKEGLFNTTAYRSIVAKHCEAEVPGGNPVSVVVGNFLGWKRRDKDADPEADPFDMIAIYEGKGCIRKAEQAIERISTHLGWHSKQCDVG
jgi:hypothetical protein